MRLWDIESGKELHRHPAWMGEQLTRLHLGPNDYVENRSRYAATLHEGVASVWEVENDRELARFGDPDHPVRGTYLSPGGRYLLTHVHDQPESDVNNARSHRLVEVDTGRELRRFDEELWVGFHPDGKHLLLRSADSIVFWDIEKGVDARRISGLGPALGPGNYSGVTVDISPSGRHALIDVEGSEARTELWDIERRVKLRPLPGRSSLMGDAFSPDGRYARTTSDETARLWETATGREVRVLTGHTQELAGLTFSPDGKRVATTSKDGTALLCDIDYRDAARRVCARLHRDLTAAERSTYGITDATPTCPGVLRQ